MYGLCWFGAVLYTTYPHPTFHYTGSSELLWWKAGVGFPFPFTSLFLPFFFRPTRPLSYALSTGRGGRRGPHMQEYPLLVCGPARMRLGIVLRRGGFALSLTHAANIGAACSCAAAAAPHTPITDCHGQSGWGNQHTALKGWAPWLWGWQGGAGAQQSCAASTPI